MRTAALPRVPETLAPRPVRTALLLAATTLLHLACAPSAAQRPAGVLDEFSGAWRELGRGEHGVLYLDTAAVRVIDDQVYQVRTWWRFSAPQHEPDGATYRTSVAVRAVDCRSGRIALLAFANRDGAITTQVASQPLFAAQWDAVRPASLSARIVEAACGESRPSPRLASQLRGQE